MAFETWLAFLAAATAMLLIPGPAILPVIGQWLGGGARDAAPLVAGRISRAARRQGIRRAFNRTSGAVLVGAGLAVVLRRG